MSCPTTKCLCERLILSQAVTFADNTLTITIPDGTYLNGEKYCIVIAQPIPTTATIGSNVVIQIGAATTTYPLVNSNCTNVSVCQIKTRTRYSVRVCTNMQSGVFRLTGNVCSCIYCKDGVASLPVVDAAEEANENA